MSGQRQGALYDDNWEASFEAGGLRWMWWAMSLALLFAAWWLVLEQAQTTGEGGGLEYVTVANEGTEAAELGGYELGEVDPDTGEPTGSGRLTVDDGTAVQPGSAISIGRAPDVEGADEQQVAGTFGGGASLELRPGDQLALIDRDGGVAATITL